MSLEFVDCPDRRLTRAAAELVSHEAAAPGTQVTAILPRRSFSPLLGRLLHDRTADKIAGVVSRVPNAAATIIPFDVQNRLRVLQERQAESEGTRRSSLTPVPGPPADRQLRRAGRPMAGRRRRRRPARQRCRGTATRRGPGPSRCPAPAATTGPYRRRASPRSARSTSRAGPWSRAGSGWSRSGRCERNSVLACEISDSTGDLTALFYGRSNIPGLMCGSRVRLRGAGGPRSGGTRS